MVTQQDLEDLGEEIRRLIEDKGIQPEMYSLGIRISREEYDRIKEGLAGTQADSGHTFALVTPTWSIQIKFPFLDVKPIESHKDDD